MRSTPTSAARSSVRLLLQASTRIPNASPTRATWAPIRPSPTTPRVCPARSRPTVDCQPPAAIAVASGTRCRASPRTSAQVSSPGAEARLSVPQTVIPRSRQASTSMLALRRPVVTTSRSAGSAATTRPGSGVRSRISTTASYGVRRSTSAASSATWSVKTSTSARARTGDQSAIDRATPW